MFFLTGITYAQNSIDKTITIGPNLSFQNYEHFKRLTLQSPDSDIEYLDGFEFDWGYTYKLRVKETKLKSMLSDGTQYNYSLVKIISKKKENDTTQFRMMLDANIYYYNVDSTELALDNTFRKINDTIFIYFDKVEIEVPPTLIEEFNLILKNQTRKVGIFCYVNRKRIRLIKL